MLSGEVVDLTTRRWCILTLAPLRAFCWRRRTRPATWLWSSPHVGQHVHGRWLACAGRSTDENTAEAQQQQPQNRARARGSLFLLLRHWLCGQPSAGVWAQQLEGSPTVFVDGRYVATAPRGGARETRSTNHRWRQTELFHLLRSSYYVGKARKTRVYI